MLNLAEDDDVDSLVFRKVEASEEFGRDSLLLEREGGDDSRLGTFANRGLSWRNAEEATGGVDVGPLSMGERYGDRTPFDEGLELGPLAQSCRGASSMVTNGVVVAEAAKGGLRDRGATLWCDCGEELGLCCGLSNTPMRSWKLGVGEKDICGECAL